MVAKKIEAEVWSGAERVGERSEGLAEVASMDAIDGTIEACLSRQYRWTGTGEGPRRERIVRGGGVMPPKYFIAVDESGGVQYLEWTHRDSGEMTKRAWIEHRASGGEEDWTDAPAGRYLVVASLVNGALGARFDFPVFSTSEDELVLREFLHGLSPVVTAAASSPAA